MSRRASTAALRGKELTSAGAQDGAPRHRAHDGDAMGKADGQGVERQAARRRHELSPHAVPALPVEHFAGFKIALGNGDHVAAPGLGRAGRLTAQAASTTDTASSSPMR
jgi:hypothetical protein